MRARGELLGHRGGTIVGHEDIEEIPAPESLAESVNEAFGALVDILLHMAGEAGTVVEDRERHRGDPLACRGQGPALAIMKIEMPQSSHVIEFEAALFARLQMRFGGKLPWHESVAGTRLLDDPLRFQVAAQGGVRKQPLQNRLLTSCNFRTAIQIITYDKSVVSG